VNGKTVAAAPFRYRAAHHALVRVLEPIFEKCDLRRYFPSIDHEILRQRIGRTVADRRVMARIRRILDSHMDGQRMEWGEDLFDCHLRRHGLTIGKLYCRAA
jgi:RNA-directed DNA polymerase